MNSEAIIREIGLGDDITPPRECVSCGKEQSPIDIATQAVQEPAAGMHTCQTCLAVSVEDVLAGSNISSAVDE